MSSSSAAPSGTRSSWRTGTSRCTRGIGLARGVHGRAAVAASVGGIALRLRAKRSRTMRRIYIDGLSPVRRARARLSGATRPCTAKGRQDDRRHRPAAFHLDAGVVHERPSHVGQPRPRSTAAASTRPARCGYRASGSRSRIAWTTSRPAGPRRGSHWIASRSSPTTSSSTWFREGARRARGRTAGRSARSSASSSRRAHADRPEQLAASRGRLRCQDVQLVTADVTSFEMPDDVTVVYMRDPFGGAVFTAALDAMVASVDRAPRRVRISYSIPREHDRLMASGRVRQRGHPPAVEADTRMVRACWAARVRAAVGGGRRRCLNALPPRRRSMSTASPGTSSWAARDRAGRDRVRSADRGAELTDARRATRPARRSPSRRPRTGPGNAEDAIRTLGTANALIASPSVVNGTAARLRLRPTEVAGALTSRVDPTANIIDVTGSAASPALAARIANAGAETFLAVRRAGIERSLVAPQNAIRGEISRLTSGGTAGGVGELEARLADLQVRAAFAGEDLRLLSPAVPPSEAAAPRPILDGFIALVVAAIVMALAVVTRDTLRRRVTSTGQLGEIAGTPVVALLDRPGPVRAVEDNDAPARLAVESWLERQPHGRGERRRGGRRRRPRRRAARPGVRARRPRRPRGRRRPRPARRCTSASRCRSTPGSTACSSG